MAVGRAPGRRAEVARIRQEARFFGDPVVEDLNPSEVLMYGLKTSYAICKYLQGKLAEWGIEHVDEETGLPKLQQDLPGAVGGLVRVTKDQELWLKAYRDERKLMMSNAKMCIEAGISERQMRLAEAQAEVMFQIINRMVDALGLTPEQQLMVPRKLPEIIREIESGGAAASS